jgi:hypothetical protein
MRQYSPYDNIKPQGYPAMLVKTSLNDSQVMFWEGAKFAARLRGMKTDDHPVLLKVNFGAGHGGASGRYDALRETAFNWAFALWQVEFLHHHVRADLSITRIAREIGMQNLGDRDAGRHQAVEFHLLPAGRRIACIDAQHQCFCEVRYMDAIHPVAQAAGQGLDGL